MDEFTSFLNLIKRSEAEEQGKFATDFAENMAKIDNAFSSTKQKLDDIDAALNGKASTTHATTHITGGTDIIPNAVAGGNSGLMTGADKQNLNDAVAKKHEHTNKALLDTYTQTENNLADAVTKKHTKNDDQYLDYSGDNRVSASEIKEAITELDAHKNNTSNPHQVTASQVGAAPTTHTHSGGDITSAVSEAENATTVNDIYFRITEGVLEYSLDGTTYTPVEGTGSSGGIALDQVILGVQIFS